MEACIAASTGSSSFSSTSATRRRFRGGSSGGSSFLIGVPRETNQTGTITPLNCARADWVVRPPTYPEKRYHNKSKPPRFRQPNYAPVPSSDV